MFAQEEEAVLLIRSALDITYYALFGVTVCWMLYNVSFLLGFKADAAPITGFIGTLATISIIAMAFLRFLKLKNTEWTVLSMTFAITFGTISTISIAGAVLRNNIYPAPTIFEKSASLLPIITPKASDSLAQVQNGCCKFHTSRMFF